MLKNILKREVIKQFLKFCFVGVTITTFSYLIFFFLYYFFSVNYLISSGLGFILGVLLGFTLNRVYTFKSNKKSLITKTQYFLVYSFSLVFTLISIHFLVEFLFFNPIFSNLLLQPFIILINFFGTKIFVFKNKKW